MRGIESADMILINRIREIKRQKIYLFQNQYVVENCYRLPRGRRFDEKLGCIEALERAKQCPSIE